MSKFEEQLKAFVEKTKKNANLVVREAILGVGGELVLRSPVGDPASWEHPAPKNYVPGTFKANWVGGLNQINYTTTDETDPTGELSMVNISAALPEKVAGTIFYLSNSLPYADALERGHSKQAPAGMVGLTVQGWQRIVDASIYRVVG